MSGPSKAPTRRQRESEVNALTLTSAVPNPAVHTDAQELVDDDLGNLSPLDPNSASQRPSFGAGTASAPSSQFEAVPAQATAPTATTLDSDVDDEEAGLRAQGIRPVTAAAATTPAGPAQVPTPYEFGHTVDDNAFVGVASAAAPGRPQYVTLVHVSNPRLASDPAKRYYSLSFAHNVGMPIAAADLCMPLRLRANREQSTVTRETTIRQNGVAAAPRPTGTAYAPGGDVFSVSALTLHTQADASLKVRAGLMPPTSWERYAATVARFPLGLDGMPRVPLGYPFVEGGWVFDRHVRFQGPTTGFGINDGFLIRAGLRF